MSDSAQTPASSGSPSTSKPVTPIKASMSPTIVGAVGVLLVLAAAGAVAMKSGVGLGIGDSTRTTVSFVDPRDLNDAAGTLTQSVAGGLVDDARRCRIPLVSMTIAKGTAQVGSTLRIRSGSYVSPYFTVTEGMQRNRGALPRALRFGRRHLRRRRQRHRRHSRAYTDQGAPGSADRAKHSRLVAPGEPLLAEALP